MAMGYVRPARPDEASEIARIQISTWRVAYRRLLPADVLDRLDPEWMARRWRDSITDPPSPRHRVLVAIEQAARAEFAGFIAGGPADEQSRMPEEPPLPDGVAALTDLLVEPRWGRRGHGSRLLAAMVDHWRDDGFTTALAWAFESDPATRGFLAATGWEPDGARRALDVDDLLVEQLRYHTAVPAEASPAEGGEPAAGGSAETADHPDTEGRSGTAGGSERAGSEAE